MQRSYKQVFFYPLSFSPRPPPGSTSRFCITLKLFKREIYRPITGKDRLFSQTSLDPPLKLKFDIPLQSLASGVGETCLKTLCPSLKHLEQRVREDLILYAIRLHGESGGRAFKLEADAEDVETYLMEESKGWSTTFIPTKSSPVDECSICLDELCDEDGIVLQDCCHGFHKECLCHWIWSKNSCPLCRLPVFSKPKI